MLPKAKRTGLLSSSNRCPGLDLEAEIPVHEILDDRMSQNAQVFCQYALQDGIDWCVWCASQTIQRKTWKETEVKFCSLVATQQANVFCLLAKIFYIHNSPINQISARFQLLKKEIELPGLYQ